MRIGENPEKQKSRKHRYKPFRVIMPVYIPEDESDYFKDAFAVFKKSIYSLLTTIDTEKTNITIINNDCNKEVTAYINQLLISKSIDRIVHCKENYGKIYTVIQEARGCYEKYVAIVDSDVFFFSNWQNEALAVFNNFQNVGVVGLTPDPNTAFYCNCSLFMKEYMSVKKGKIVEHTDLELFESGINKKDFFVTAKKNWKESQFYLEKNGIKAIIGAGHFASVYRKKMFERFSYKKPVNVFPGGELRFLDTPIDELGYYRVSLPKAHVYHLGNSIPDWIDTKKNFNSAMINNLKESRKIYVLFPYYFKCIFLRLLRRLNFYK